MGLRNTEDHSTPEGVPGDKSDYGENNARIFSTIDDETRVVPAVEFRNVKFAYGDEIVLNDISFRVMRGELLIVLSASGGGKSTILKLALGLMKPDEGRILIDGDGIEYVRFMASTYAGYRPNGQVILIEEKDQLCLINTRIMMLREGRIIFNGSDEELFISEDKYIRQFLLL